jgi:hypothetical protein
MKWAFLTDFFVFDDSGFKGSAQNFVCTSTAAKGFKLTRLVVATVISGPLSQQIRFRVLPLVLVLQSGASVVRRG